MEHIEHSIQPVYDAHSRVLLLGTMPSPKSREYGFFYGHPQNRFWRVLAAVLEEPLPHTNEEKRALLLRRHVALWDVLAACDIEGAQDASIKNPVPNDFTALLGEADIRAVFTTGGTAFRLYQKLVYPRTRLAAVRLPSTSPANCSVGLEALTAQYAAILQYL